MSVTNAMTKQEIFELSTRGIIGQGGPATDPYTGTCQYRASGGKKCAAGWLVSDDDYAKYLIDDNIGIEYTGIGMSQHAKSYFEEKFGKENTDLLLALQRAHDDAAIAQLESYDNFWIFWLGELTEVVKDFSLNGDVLKEIPSLGR